MSIMHKDGEPIDTDFEAEEFYEVAYKTFCEVEGCDNEATLEYMTVDYEEGKPEVYSTDRCEQHPVEDASYTERIL